MHEWLSNAWTELVGRQSGPLHLRLLLQPAVATVLAVRSGRLSSRRGESRTLGVLRPHPGKWQRCLMEAWRDVGTLFLVGFALDLTYQVIALHAIRVSHALIVAVVLAVVPYVIVRRLTTSLIRIPI